MILSDILSLREIDETNFKEAEALRIRPEQEGFVVPAVDILARAYAYRRCSSICFGIYAQNRMVGLMLRMDAEEENCYYLFEFLIDAEAQGKGYGQQALALFLEDCRREGKYPEVEVCVKRRNTCAIHVYEKAGFRDSGWQDPNAPDRMCMVCKLPAESASALRICLTGEEDLENVQRLWASPEVMGFVGFPDGLHETMEHLRERWLPWVQQPPKRQHYSVYLDGEYCGESFYNVDEKGYASMDIKLLPWARGKGIGTAALSYALDQAFSLGGRGSGLGGSQPGEWEGPGAVCPAGVPPGEAAGSSGGAGLPLCVSGSEPKELGGSQWRFSFGILSCGIWWRGILTTISDGTPWKRNGRCGTHLGKWKKSC